MIITYAKLPEKIRAVIAEAAERNCAHPVAVVGKTKKSNVVQARKEVCIALREMKFSYSVIGEFLNKSTASIYQAVNPGGARSIKEHI